jgi:hypothetical protein
VKLFPRKGSALTSPIQALEQVVKYQEPITAKASYIATDSIILEMPPKVATSIFNNEFCALISAFRKLG